MLRLVWYDLQFRSIFLCTRALEGPEQTQQRVFVFLTDDAEKTLHSRLAANIERPEVPQRRSGLSLLVDAISVTLWNTVKMKKQHTPLTEDVKARNGTTGSVTEAEVSWWNTTCQLPSLTTSQESPPWLEGSSKFGFARRPKHHRM